MLTMNFTPPEKALARLLLKQCPVPRDRLPYTPEFEALYTEFIYASGGRMIGRDVFWRLLSSAAKAGGLAKRRKAK